MTRLVVIDQGRDDYATCPRCRACVPVGRPGTCHACTTPAPR